MSKPAYTVRLLCSIVDALLNSKICEYLQNTSETYNMRLNLLIYWRSHTLLETSSYL